MSIALGIALFITIWWTVLFAVLPFGVRSQHEAGAEEGPIVSGTDPGAPMRPRLLAKALWTTLISVVIFAGLMAYILYA
jgi:predicted secreted protein